VNVESLHHQFDRKPSPKASPSVELLDVVIFSSPSIDDVNVELLPGEPPSDVVSVVAVVVELLFDGDIVDVDVEFVMISSLLMVILFVLSRLCKGGLASLVEIQITDIKSSTNPNKVKLRVQQEFLVRCDSELLNRRSSIVSSLDG